MFFRRRPCTSPPLDTPFELNRASPQARGLVAWWPPIAGRGANRLLDLAGRGLHGDVWGSAGPSWTPDTTLGTALVFPGSGYDYVRVSSQAPFNPGGGSMSWSFWSGQGGSPTQSIGKNNTLNYQGYIFQRGSTTLSLWLMDTTGFEPIVYPGLVVTSSIFGGRFLGTLVLNREAGLYQIYADGILMGQADVSSWSGVVSNTDRFCIGHGYDGGGSPSAGQMGEVRVYNVALSPAVIWQMWDPASRWDLYLPAVRLWALGAPLTAARFKALLGVGR